MVGDFVQVATRDGVNLEGLVFCPKDNQPLADALRGSTPKAVGVWIHGLGSNFHRGYKRTTILARIFNEAGIGFAAFDTRGHDWIAHGARNDKRKAKGYRGITIGSAFEKFTDSALDLDAIVDELGKRFKKVILLGHSTGANKEVYYLSRPGVQKKVHGVALISPVSDVPMVKKELGEKYEETLKTLQEMIKKRQSFEIVPRELSRNIYTSQRLWSLGRQESIEQMFPTRSFHGPLRLFGKIRIPALILFGENDDYLKTDKVSAEAIFKLFAKYSRSQSFTTHLVKNTDHSFTGKEEELGKILVGWIRGL